jgi:hypothetical protein
MSLKTYTSAKNRDGEPKAIRGIKLGFMDVGSATNQRTMITSLVADAPCGNKVPVLKTEGQPVGDALLCSVLNSFVYDYQFRNRLGGLTLNYFILEESALPSLSTVRQTVRSWLTATCLGLNAGEIGFAEPWFSLGVSIRIYPWRRLWVITLHERLRLRCMLDAVVAALYGLDWDDLAWVLRNCDQPVACLRDRAFYRTLDPKGFWRVDKDTDPELRHTVLTLIAFRDLKDTIATHGGDRDRGIAAFCGQNDGDGWMLPETLRLADIGLGHDERARESQPVRERLGPRFLPWQLEQSVEDSWAECALHARNLLGEAGFARLQQELQGTSGIASTTVPLAAEQAEGYHTGMSGAQRRLFPGEPTLFGESWEDPPSRRRRR